MIQIEDKIISRDIFEQSFCCDLSKCEGFCCVEGQSGAPLEEEETTILESILPVIRPFLQEKALKFIKEKGAWETDADGEKVTPLINVNEECVYAYFENNICKCAIEKAYNEGLIDFIKPISCHLYPIRITNYDDFEALNYHNWHVCKPARDLGKKNNIPVFRFLKEAITRKYGERFYKEMEEVFIVSCPVEFTIRQDGV